MKTDITKQIICKPLLEKVNISPYLNSSIEGVTVGGESGEEARICKYDWVLDLQRQCMENNVHFHFKQTVAKFVKDGNLYRIKRMLQHSQATKADIDI